MFETANAGFAQAMYEEFLRDPAAVGPEWRRLFESGVVGEAPDGNGAAAPAPPGSPADPSAAVPAAPAQPAPRPRPFRPAPRPSRAPPPSCVANMTESLTVPTATTFRVLPVGVLEERRRGLNQGLQAAGKPAKISFTHLIAFALVQATKQHPVMGHTLVVQDGTPYRVVPEGIALGLAVDVQRKDGSRGLVVPVIKRADTMDFAAFHAAYEALVEKARTNRLMPDDFAGATMSLTNPGGLGTVASVPRLMAGQGSIIAVGAIGYPAEFSARAEERLREFGISKVMTDHEHLRSPGHPGRGVGSVSRDGGPPAPGGPGLLRADRREPRARRGRLSARRGRRPRRSPARRPPARSRRRCCITWPRPWRWSRRSACTATSRRISIRSARPPIGDPALNPGPLGLTPEVMAAIPSKVLRIAVPGRDAGRVAALSPGHLLRHDGVRDRAHLDPRGAGLAPREDRERRLPAADGAGRAARLLKRLTEVETLERFLHKAYLGQKRFSIEGVDMLVPMLDLTIERAAETGARDVVIGMAHRGRLNVLAHTVGRPYETIFAEFEGGRHVEAGQLTPEGGTGDVKYHHGAEGAYRDAARARRSPSRCRPIRAISSSWRRWWTGARAPGRPSAAAATPHHDPTAALPVTIHGDAAFAGQGVVAETLNLGALKGYRTGGTLHIITNNQVGFTTDMDDARSTRYASDLAKGFDIPIIHVNADDAEACLSRRPAVDGVPRQVPPGRADRPGRLPPPRPQRGRRAGVHAAGHVRADQEPAAGARAATPAPLVRAGVLTAGGGGPTQAAEAYQRLVDIQQGFKAEHERAARRASSRTSSPAPGQEVDTALAARVPGGAQRAAAAAGPRGSRSIRSCASSSSGAARRSGPRAESTGRTPRRWRSRRC